MEFIYRGHRYRTTDFPLQDCGVEFPCTYRGVSYQLKPKRPTIAGAPKPVNLTYRGIPYTHQSMM